MTLTAAGRSLVAELQRIGRESQRGFLDALSPTEQRTLITLLRRVLERNDNREASADVAMPLADRRM